MRWVPVVVLGALVAGCPRGPTGPANPDPSTIPDAALAGLVPPDAPDASVDAAIDASPDGPPEPTAEEEAQFDACAEACTMYAVCYELVYGEDYFKGSNCMSECEDMAAADRTDFFKSAAAIESLRGKRRSRACEKLIGE